MKDRLDFIQSTCPSKTVNVWRVFLGKEYFITPAHVAIHIKEGKWKKSHFLKDFEKFTWRVPSKWIETKNSAFDFAWAETNDKGNYLTPSDNSVFPQDADFFFRQPYNADGVWVKSSAFSSLHGKVYVSPESKLLEVLDVGFRGMSGAMAISNSDLSFLGMLVRRAASLGLEPDGENLHKINDNERSDNKETRKESNQKIFVHRRAQDKEYRKDGSKRGDGENLDKLIELVEDMDLKLDSKFIKLENDIIKLDNKFIKLDNEVLKKQHLEKLLTIIALRRSLLMPPQMMINLMNDRDFKLVDELDGKYA